MKTHYKILQTISKATAITLLMFMGISTFGQNIGINTTGGTPNTSAALDIDFANKGLLLPRVALTDVTVAAPVASPATSLLVYNTNTVVGVNGVVPGFYYWNGTKWVPIGVDTDRQQLSINMDTIFLERGGFVITQDSMDWHILGNAGTDANVNFIGTTDNQNLIFKTNSSENMRISTNGGVSIGTPQTLGRLTIDFPATVSNGIGVYNDLSGTSDSSFGIKSINSNASRLHKAGFYSLLDTNGAGNRYGVENYVHMKESFTGTYTGKGAYNYLVSEGAGYHGATHNYLLIGNTSLGNRNYSSHNQVAFKNNTNSTTVYGEYTEVDSSAGIRYGEYKDMLGSNVYTTGTYGDYNMLQGNSKGAMYGTYNNIRAAGQGLKYAVYNNLNSPSTGVQTGVYNNASGPGTGAKYGVYNLFNNTDGDKYGVFNLYYSGASTGDIFGVNNQILNDGDGDKYGVYNHIAGGGGALYGSRNYVQAAATNSQSLFGVYGYVENTGTGRHYGGHFTAYGSGNFGVYGSNGHATGYAAYFVGNGYWDGRIVFNETGFDDHDFRVESDVREYAIFVDADEDIVRFGTGFTTSDAGNGSVVSGVTVDYVADFDNMSATGTAIGIGSVEYLLDATSKTLINNAFAPTTFITSDLGSSTTAEAWDDVFADDYINVSDAREKESVVDLEYGLKEVMQLRPVSYTLKRDPFGEKKLGLIAQEALNLIPESVKTHNHVLLDESKPNEFTKVEMERMGMKYNALIPVLINAIQEQQKMIDSQQQIINEMKLRLESLETN